MWLAGQTRARNGPTIVYSGAPVGREGDKRSGFLSGEVGIGHVLDEVGRSVEHPSQSGLDMAIRRKGGVLVQDEDLEVCGYPFPVPSQIEDQMIVGEEEVHLFAEGVELEGRRGEVRQVLHDISPRRVAVDVPDHSQIVVVGGDNAGPVPVAPQVSCPAHCPVVPDSDS